MRVNKPYSLALPNVLYGHILEHCGLAHSCLPDNVHVSPPIICFDAKFLLGVAKSRFAEKIYSAAHKIGC